MSTKAARRDYCTSPRRGRRCDPSRPQRACRHAPTSQPGAHCAADGAPNAAWLVPASRWWCGSSAAPKPYPRSAVYSRSAAPAPVRMCARRAVHPSHAAGAAVVREARPFGRTVVPTGCHRPSRRSRPLSGATASAWSRTRRMPPSGKIDTRRCEIRSSPDAPRARPRRTRARRRARGASRQQHAPGRPPPPSRRRCWGSRRTRRPRRSTRRAR